MTFMLSFIIQGVQTVPKKISCDILILDDRQAPQFPEGSIFEFQYGLYIVFDLLNFGGNASKIPWISNMFPKGQDAIFPLMVPTLMSREKPKNVDLLQHGYSISITFWMGLFQAISDELDIKSVYIADLSPHLGHKLVAILLSGHDYVGYVTEANTVQAMALTPITTTTQQTQPGPSPITTLVPTQTTQTTKQTQKSPELETLKHKSPDMVSPPKKVPKVTKNVSPVNSIDDGDVDDDDD